jgi:hypothetical protein
VGKAISSTGPSIYPNHLDSAYSNILRISLLGWDTAWASDSCHDIGMVGIIGTKPMAWKIIFQIPIPPLEAC